jgi:hypothetical protein
MILQFTPKIVIWIVASVFLIPHAKFFLLFLKIGLELHFVNHCRIEVLARLKILNIIMVMKCIRPNLIDVEFLTIAFIVYLSTL